MNKIILILLIFLSVLTLLIVPGFFRAHGVASSNYWNEDDTYSIDSVTTLKMNKNKEFKILVLSDVQMNILSIRRNKLTLDLIEKMVTEQQPDLIVTTGDNVSLTYQSIITKQFIKKMESFQIPWAVTFGNHDAEFSVDSNYLGNLYEKADYSLFKMGPANVDGVGNYQINIQNQSGETVKSLIMLDSHSKVNYENGKDYDYIHNNQLEWYEWVTTGLENKTGQVIPSLLFFHIPLLEMDLALNDSTSTVLFGEQNEGVYSAPISSGLFELIKTQKSTTHIFNGHDHINNISVLYQGIQMTYGLKTGITSYHSNELQGSTLITINDTDYKTEVEHLFYK